MPPWSCILLFATYQQLTSAFWNSHYLELSLCRTFYLVPSAFSLTSLLNPFGISNSPFWNLRYVKKFSRSLLWLLDCFHPLSRTFEWGFQMNNTVHFRHSNVNNCIDKTLFESLFSLFFNIVQATTCSQLSENSV